MIYVVFMRAGDIVLYDGQLETECETERALKATSLVA